MRSKRQSLQVALARKRSEVPNPEVEAFFMISIDFSFSTTHNPEATQSLPAEIP